MTVLALSFCYRLCGFSLYVSNTRKFTVDYARESPSVVFWLWSGYSVSASSSQRTSELLFWECEQFLQPQLVPHREYTVSLIKTNHTNIRKTSCMVSFLSDCNQNQNMSTHLIQQWRQPRFTKHSRDAETKSLKLATDHWSKKNRVNSCHAFAVPQGLTHSYKKCKIARFEILTDVLLRTQVSGDLSTNQWVSGFLSFGGKYRPRNVWNH